jgi:serine/threonine-protein kinase RsbW
MGAPGYDAGSALAATPLLEAGGDGGGAAGAELTSGGGPAPQPDAGPASGEIEAGRDSADDEFEAQTVSAFGEAFNNIAIHSYRAGPPGDVDIEIESDGGGIVIRLMDTGTSFDPASVIPPDMEDLPESGMGLFIMHSFMDEVEYRPGSPNVLRLVKRRDTGSHLSGDGGERRESDVGDDLADPSSDHRTSGHSGIRMRSVTRTSQERAAGGIKIQ